MIYPHINPAVYCQYLWNNYEKSIFGGGQKHSNSLVKIVNKNHTNPFHMK